MYLSELQANSIYRELDQQHTRIINMLLDHLPVTEEEMELLLEQRDNLIFSMRMIAEKRRFHNDNSK